MLSGTDIANIIRAFEQRVSPFPSGTLASLFGISLDVPPTQTPPHATSRGDSTPTRPKL
jgi:hypothetical protein